MTRAWHKSLQNIKFNYWQNSLGQNKMRQICGTGRKGNEETDCITDSSTELVQEPALLGLHFQIVISITRTVSWFCDYLTAFYKCLGDAVSVVASLWVINWKWDGSKQSGVFKALFQHLLGENEETHAKSEPGQPAPDRELNPVSVIIKFTVQILNTKMGKKH